jgi:hypothetical protein
MLCIRRYSLDSNLTNIGFRNFAEETIEEFLVASWEPPF